MPLSVCSDLHGTITTWVLQLLVYTISGYDPLAVDCFALCLSVLYINNHDIRLPGNLLDYSNLLKNFIWFVSYFMATFCNSFLISTTSVWGGFKPQVFHFLYVILRILCAFFIFCLAITWIDQIHGNLQLLFFVPLQLCYFRRTRSCSLSKGIMPKWLFTKGCSSCWWCLVHSWRMVRYYPVLFLAFICMICSFFFSPSLWIL